MSEEEAPSQEQGAPASSRDRVSILFVDDEDHVLQGLRRTLRSMRKEWDMRFAGGGREALEALASEAADIVVSDMKMPHMDGSALLLKIKELYPNTIRIILSGHCDDEALVRTMGCMHQFLSKPCDAKALKTVILRACRLRERLDSPRLVKLANKIESLPSLPAIYFEIIEELHRPHASLETIGEVIAKDIGLSTKILQIVNSAYFSLPNPIRSVPRATAFLGLQLVKGAVLGAHVFDDTPEMRELGVCADQMMDIATYTGSIAKTLAREHGLGDEACDDAFLAGMLHDVGTLVLAANLPREFAAYAERTDQGADPDDAGLEIFGVTTNEIGAYLLGIWGMPDSILEAIAFSGNPSVLPDPEFDILSCVHIARVVANESFGSQPIAIDEDYVRSLELEDKLEAMRDRFAPAGTAAQDR